MTRDSSSMTEQFAGIGRRIIIATHRRSGTHLTIDLLRRQFAECQSWKWFGEQVHHLYLTLELINRHGFQGARSHASLSMRQAMRILRRPARPIVKTHALPDFQPWKPQFEPFINELMRDADVLYIVRDGRDVLASMHVYAQYFRADAHCPLSQFIRQESEGESYVAAWANHVRAWAAQPGVKVLRFEDIVRDTRRVVEQVGEYLKLEPLFVEPLLPRRLRHIWQSRWLRIASRRPEQTTILSDGYNRRVKSDWRAALGPEDRAYFHHRAGDVLLRFGYEDSDAWITQSPQQPAPRAVAAAD